MNLPMAEMPVAKFIIASMKSATIHERIPIPLPPFSIIPAGTMYKGPDSGQAPLVSATCILASEVESFWK